MTKTIPLILALSVSSLFAGYSMAFAKATRDISLGSQSATVRYLMEDNLKGYFEKDMTKSLSENNISVGTGKEITIVPIAMGPYYPITKSKQLLPKSKPLSEIDAFIVNFTPMFPVISLLCFHPFHKHVSTYFTRSFHLETVRETNRSFPLAV